MKIGAILLLVVLATIPLISADDSMNSSYSCLEGKVKGKCSQLTLEEQAFSLLALSYDSGIQSECKSAIMNKAKNNECWPSSACKLRDTALVTLALQHINANYDKPESWLISQNKTPSDLSWFLEIDTKEASTCKIYLDNSSTPLNTVSQSAEKTLSLSGSSSCLSLANYNYWLQISSSCVNRIFKVSCDKDFSTALLYRKNSGTGSDVWYVSSRTESASAGGKTENLPQALCLKQNNECNYEGTLWGVLALQKNKDISIFLPYLIAMSSDNEKLNPDSFLYILSGSDKNLANLRASQNPAGYYDFSSGYSRYYDTALSLLALRSLDDSGTLKEWLISAKSDSGCWQNSIRDTAFILFAGWGKEPSASSLISNIDYCEDAGKSCSSRTECIDAGGQVLENFVCRVDSLKSCCSVKISEKTCSEKSGIPCLSNEECSGNLVSSADSSRCCVSGTCEKVSVPGCESAGYSCKSSCISSEEPKSGSGLDCPYDKLCCGLVEKKTSWWWVWILIILIILVVIAIIFRKRIQVLIFKFKNNKGKSSPVQQTRPPFPLQYPPRQMPKPIFFPKTSTYQQAAKPKSKVDEELESTLKKLKEMSK